MLKLLEKVVNQWQPTLWTMRLHWPLLSASCVAS